MSMFFGLRWQSFACRQNAVVLYPAIGIYICLDGQRIVDTAQRLWRAICQRRWRVWMVRLEEVCSQNPHQHANEQRSNDHCGRGKSSFAHTSNRHLSDARSSLLFTLPQIPEMRRFCLEVVNELQQRCSSSTHTSRPDPWEYS